jgi:hypothetical protein
MESWTRQTGGGVDFSLLVGLDAPEHCDRRCTAWLISRAAVETALQELTEHARTFLNFVNGERA